MLNALQQQQTPPMQLIPGPSGPPTAFTPQYYTPSMTPTAQYLPHHVPQAPNVPQQVPQGQQHVSQDQFQQLLNAVTGRQRHFPASSGAAPTSSVTAQPRPEDIPVDQFDPHQSIPLDIVLKLLEIAKASNLSLIHI